MNMAMIKILDYVNTNKKELNIDQKVNYVYQNYDIGLSLMNEVREYFKQNTLQN
jgi:ABC-type branched-subunit amino acid transport system substrate-binding protein